MNAADLLFLLEHRLHLVALGVFLLVYAARLVWLFRLGTPQDFAIHSGDARKGIAYAFATLFMPWSMESTRKHWRMYLEFAIFHIGLGVMIASTFLFTYAPQILAPPVNFIFAALMAAALVAGLLWIARRVTQPKMRAISTWDDYFSIVMVCLLLFTCSLAVFGSVPWRIAYYILVSVLLIYVPFSKISHYLYWPFARFLYGYELGRRGLVK